MHFGYGISAVPLHGLLQTFHAGVPVFPNNILHLWFDIDSKALPVYCMTSLHANTTDYHSA